MPERNPITGRSVWSGDDLRANGDWIYSVEATHLEELDAAIQATSHQPLEEITRADFSLPTLAPMLAAVGDELENGRGVARLRGLPVGRHTSEYIQRMFWGAALHLGVPVYQNASGERLAVIEDLSTDPDPSKNFAGETGVKSAAAKALSTDSLNFHTDGADVIGLLCVRNAARGGESKIASTAKAYNEILGRRPDLLEVLFADWWHLSPRIAGGVYQMPLFGMADGKLTSMWSPANLRKAHEVGDTPPLTQLQQEALALLLEVQDAHCALLPFEPGDAQFLNNHVVSHGRTSFENGPDRASSRAMMRVWVSTPESRPLPASLEVLWGETRPGHIRGGAPQADGRRAALIAA
jgi:hypothetical protein